MSNIGIVAISQIVSFSAGVYFGNQLFMTLSTGGLIALLTVATLDGMNKK